MQRIEVSHKIEMGMKTYPGLPEPRAEVLIDYDSGRYGGLSEFYIASLHCCGNTDWSMLLKRDIDILNFDAYNFVKEFSLYHADIKNFISFYILNNQICQEQS